MPNSNFKKQTLTLAVIAKNEAAGLERAILSCRSMVDQIIISVDSKSTDDTLNIAKKYADKVIIHEWENNFAELRNMLQLHATSDWVLWLDGHEYVSQCENLQQALNSDADGLYTKIELEGGFEFYFPRLIKRNVQWAFAVHNSPQAKHAIQYPSFLITHDRRSVQPEEYREERSEQRNEMIQGMLGNLARTNKKDSRAHFYLGNLYLDNKEFKKAIYHYRKNLKYGTDKKYQWIVTYYLALCSLSLSHGWRTLWYCNKAFALEPQRWEIFKLAGTACTMLKRYEKAIQYLIKTFEESKQRSPYNPAQRNDAHTWDLIGFCFYQLQKTDQAKTAWKRALDVNEKAGGGLLDKNKSMIFKMLTQNEDEVKTQRQDIAVCLVVYSRPQRVPEILEQLKAQTLQQYHLYIWNQSGQNLDLSNFPAEKVSVTTSEQNIGSCARFKLAKSAKEDIIVFFDDDEDLYPDFLEYFYKKWLEHGEDSICGWFTRTFTSEDYWRANLNAQTDEQVDYVGTGGMILSRKIFDENETLQNIPEAFRKVEDLYLCVLARQAYQMKLFKIARKCDIIADDKDQYIQLTGYKQEAFDLFRKNGWRLLMDK